MNRTSMTLTVLAGAVALALAAPGARAGEQTRSGSYKTGKGHTGTYQGRVERAPGSVKREGSITTENGRTYSRSSSSTYDKDTGAVKREITGPGGNTRNVTGTYNKDTNVYDRTITGAKGNSVQATTTYDKAGKSATTTYTGRDGKTATSTSTYNPGTRGFDTTVTGPGGNSATRSTSNTYNPETGTLTHGVTGPKGNTRTVELTPDKPQPK
jgi:hypothetical protein